jgi:hypothetical protein
LTVPTPTSRTAGGRAQNPASAVAPERGHTIAPVQAGNLIEATPEFGRINDLQRLFGLKRGSVYNLLADGKIRGCLLRVRGSKSGVRLIDLESVREFIHGEMRGEVA